MSKTEVDSAEDVNSGNLDLLLRDDRANKEKNHIYCVPLFQILFWAIHLHSFIQFSPNSNGTDIVILFQDEDAKDPKRSFLPKVI